MSTSNQTQNLIKKIVMYYKRYGLIMLVRDVFSKIKRGRVLLFEKVVITYCPLTKPILDMTPGIPMVMKKACEEDLDELKELADRYDDWRLYDFLEWLRRGDAFILAIHNGKIIGYACAGHRDNILGGAIKLKKDDAAGLAAFVPPEYRGRRIGPCLDVAVSEHLKRQGYRRVVGWVGLSNYSARKAHMRAGVAEHITTISVFQILMNGISNSMLDKICKRAGRNLE